MLPGFPTCHLADARLTDPERGSDLTLKHARGEHLANLRDIRLGQLGRSASSPDRMRVMPESVPEIRLVRVPSQVGKTIVQWVAIIVATLHVRRAEANEYHQDETMDHEINRRTIIVSQFELFVSRPRNARLHASP
jgi:hypothetical protein